MTTPGFEPANFRLEAHRSNHYTTEYRCLMTVNANVHVIKIKVIIEKSRGKGSLMEQDTIENVN